MPVDPSRHSPTFDQLQKDAFQAIDSLIQPLVEQCKAGGRPKGYSPSVVQIEKAQVVGRTMWKIYTSIGMLSLEERGRKVGE